MFSKAHRYVTMVNNESNGLKMMFSVLMMVFMFYVKLCPFCVLAPLSGALTAATDCLFWILNWLSCARRSLEEDWFIWLYLILFAAILCARLCTSATSTTPTTHQQLQVFYTFSYLSFIVFVYLFTSFLRRFVVFNIVFYKTYHLLVFIYSNLIAIYI